MPGISNMIDHRSLALAVAVVAQIEADPTRAGLSRARRTCDRWLAQSANNPATREWHALLAKPWETIKAALLDPSAEGQRLRSSSPFCGVLPESHRREIFNQYRQFSHESLPA